MGDQILHSEVIVGDVVVEGNVDTDALVNEQQLREAVSLVSHQTLHGKYEFECVEAQESVDTSEMVSGINVTSWAQSAVLKGGSDQNISGVWRVLGSVEMKGGVTGGGRLGNVELQQLTDNIKTNMLDVHTEMKSNLTGACEEANARLASARAQHTQLHHVDVTQVFSVPSGPSLVTHFKSKSTDFLAISENSCITTIYKWSNSSGIFRSLYREHFGYSLKNFIILNNEEITYVLTESGENSTECSFNGKHLWIFMDDHFKHITNVNFFAGDLFQGEDNTLYAVNSLGMFKYVLSFDKFEGRAFFEPTPYHWNISADVPKAWSGAVEFQWLSSVYSASNCSGQMVSVAVEPSGQFVAVASTEPAEVPSSSVQIYRRDGKLFDKLSVQNVKQLQWLSVPSQTWLLTLEKNSLLNLFQLQGSVVGFQLQRTIQVEATKVTSLVLPLTFKVNLQPFLIIQSSTTVKLVQAFVQGDPYLGQDLVCGFDQILTRVPRN